MRRTVTSRLTFALVTGLLAALGVLLASVLMGQSWHDLSSPSSWGLIAAFAAVASMAPTWRPSARL